LVDLLEQNTRNVLERVQSACAAAGRPPGSVRLVAVTKSVEPELARRLVRLGISELGESRVAELERKRAAVREPGIRWHLVGHLQRNKARRAVELADEIQSVDSLRLLDTLARLAQEEGARPALWLEVKLADEPSKHGFAPERFARALARAREAALPVHGLMTIAPLLEEAGAAERRQAARAVFTRLAALARELPGDAFAGGRPLLSMGMSGDFEEAIAAGADLVRVGSALFEGIATASAESEAGGGAR
jgi:hypothetical protein